MEEKLKAELEELINAGHSLTDPKVVDVSQELDKVMNRNGGPLRINE